MSQYFDAIVIPVPRANLETYKRMSKEWGNAHLRHGALYYSDSISDDVQPGKVNFRSDGRPIAQWSRLKAGYSDELGAQALNHTCCLLARRYGRPPVEATSHGTGIESMRPTTSVPGLFCWLSTFPFDTW